MNDDELVAHWATFDPTPLQRQRIDARVAVWLDARDTPLAVEWLTLFKGAPFASLGLVAASAVALIASPPVVWLARALL